MANELLIKAGVAYTPDSDSNQLGVDSDLLKKVVTVAGDDFRAGTQVIGTNEEAIVATDQGTQGYVLIKNLASGSEEVYVGYADVSTADDARPIKLLAGEFCLLRANAALYARASAEAKIQIWSFEA